MNSAGKGTDYFPTLLNLCYTSAFFVVFICFLVFGRDAKALQEKAARKAAQSAGGNNPGGVGKTKR